MPAHSKNTWDGSRDFRADGQRGGSREREEDPLAGRERERTTMAGRRRREAGVVEREREREIRRNGGEGRVAILATTKQ